MFPCSRIVLVEIELMIGLFSVFEIIEPQGITWRSFTTRVNTNSHRYFVVTFPALHIYFIYISNMHILQLS
jgi:hypothetical protein